MFIASERLFASFNANADVFCLGTGDALKPLSFTTSSHLPAGPVVSCDWYSICHVWDILTLEEIGTSLMTVKISQHNGGVFKSVNEYNFGFVVSLSEFK